MITNTKWIKVSDRLPSKADIYIVHFTYQQFGKTEHVVTKGVYKHIGENLFFVGGEPHYDITHWMPFPEPPEESNES